VTGTDAEEARRDALVERLFGATIGAFDLCGVYIGDRVGLYRAFAERGPASAAELAGAAGINERYALEWLEQQAASAILDVIDADDGVQRFTLPAGHAEALLDEESLNYVSPFGRLLVACLRPIEAVLDAYRNGGGVPYADYGADVHEGQAAFTRPLFSRLLAQEWLPSVPEIHARLQADPPARVADLACGGGISSIAIARGYPKVRVDGIDLDTAWIEAAGGHLAGSGVENRVSFHVRDASDPALAHQFELVTVFEALHDMAYPVQVLRAARALLAEGASSSSATSARPSRLKPQPTTSNASTTVSASSTACP
jgi:Methyltransferase domain/Rv2258c-like winged HTH domain